MAIVIMTILPTNVSAATIVSHQETMYTGFNLTWQDPFWADCTDNVTGWTDYGEDWNGQNTEDLRSQQGPHLQVLVDCYTSNAEDDNWTIHTFSLEVYRRWDWIRQSSSPWASDYWYTEYNNNTTGETDGRHHTLNVTIWNAETICPWWCVYYTCEVVEPSVGFNISYQDYWVWI